MEYLLSTNCLTKQFKKFKAVDNVSMNIKQGEIYGFIGRNGAGKTTFLKMISGLAYPTSGEISLFGHNGKDMKKMFSRIGTLIEDPGFFPNLSGHDNLKLKCLCIGINKPGYITNLLKLVELADTGNKSVRNYSLGMKQRLGIAMALIGEPDLLVLDEPINGLDPQGIAEVRKHAGHVDLHRQMRRLAAVHLPPDNTLGVLHWYAAFGLSDDNNQHDNRQNAD
jgi:ABC-2 type transport system ATP-binding protein